MKKLLILLSFSLLQLTLLAQDTDTDDPVMKALQRGVTLHERGDYEAAIREYDAILSKDPKNVMAMYEKSYSLLMKKDFRESAKLSEYIIDNFKEDEHVRNAFINWGSAVDYEGNSKEAIKIYNRGLKKFPGFYLLHFNKAITYIGSNELEEAKEELVKALLDNPLHASSHHVLSLLTVRDNKIAALLSSLTYLSIQAYSGDRAKENYERVEKIIGANVSRKDEKTVNITLSLPNTKSKNQPNDFSSTEMIMSLVVAGRTSEKNKDQTDEQRMTTYLETIFSSLSEGQSKGKGFFWDFYAPFFAGMHKEKKETVLAHLMYASSGKVINEVWLQDNQDAVKSFNDWVKDFKWNRKASEKL